MLTIERSPGKRGVRWCLNFPSFWTGAVSVLNDGLDRLRCLIRLAELEASVGYDVCRATA
jgi:hypothetical protein